MTGLSLILKHSRDWLISGEFADSVAEFAFSQIPTDYVQNARAYVEKELATQKAEMKIWEEARDSMVAGNKKSSVFKQSLDSEGILQIDLRGEIVQSVSSWSMMDGGSYVSLDRLNSLIDTLSMEYDAGIRDVKALSIRMDSPGGIATPSLNTAKRLQELSQKIPYFAYNANTTASAAYGLVSFAKEIWSTEYAHIGSVGAYVSIMNTMPGNSDKGVEVVYKSSGKDKTLMTKLNEDGTLSKEAHADLQKIADRLGTEFRDFVFSARSFSEEQRKTISNAGVFSAKEALDLGMIDKIGSYDSYVKHIQSRISSGEENNMNGTTDPNAQNNANVPAGNAATVTESQKLILEFCAKNNLDVVSLGNLVSLQNSVKEGLASEVAKLYTSLMKEEKDAKDFMNLSINDLKSKADEYRTIREKNGFTNDTQGSSTSEIAETVTLSAFEAAQALLKS